MRARIGLAAWGAILALGVVATAAQTPRPTTRPAKESAHTGPNKAKTDADYVIGIGDVVAINVWKDADLSRTMPVRPDGRISLPVIGEVEVSGVTTKQLQKRIVAKLEPYVRNPQVNVIVEEIRSRTFNVLGKVAKPGSFDLVKPTTVLDALALAGGFQEYARVTHIHVLRPLPNGGQHILAFNYKAVVKGKKPAENVLLQPGDTIVVP